MSPKATKTNSASIYNLLCGLVAIPSVFPHEKRIGQYVSKYLKDLGFNVEAIPSAPGRNNIVATYGAADRYIAFYGHLDTVPPDDHYTRDPFTAWQESGKVRGLGVADMKSGIVAILRLAEFASAQNLPVKIVFGVDEENISVGAHDLVNAEALDDVNFLISAESGQIKDENQAYSVCYGRRGRIAIKAVITGKRTHAAENQKAVNAIEAAAKFITQLHEVTFTNNPRFGSTDLVVQAIESSTDSFSVPDECAITLSALTTPPTGHTDVLQRLRALAHDLDIVMTIEPLERPTPYGESYEVNRTGNILGLIEAEIFKPAKINPIYSGSVADENVFANRLKIPVISIGPIGGGDHTVDEWVSLSSIEKVIDCYQKVLRLYADEKDHV